MRKSQAAPKTGVCSSCEKPITAWSRSGMCQPCTVATIHRERHVGPGNPNWKNNQHPKAQVERCNAARGPAGLQACVKCWEIGIGEVAYDWAHVHGESGEDVWADFVALCRHHHMKYDGHTGKGNRTRAANRRARES